MAPDEKNQCDNGERDEEPRAVLNRIYEKPERLGGLRGQGFQHVGLREFPSRTYPAAK